MQRMLTIVPTRGRPHNVYELIDQFLDVTTFSDLIFGVDDDDPALDEYKAIILPEGVSMVVNPRMRQGGTLNLIAKEMAEKYDFLASINDDHRPRTNRWDEFLMGEIEYIGGWGFAYGNDLIHGHALPTTVVVSSNIVRTIGYMAPPNLQHMYIDDFWRELGKMIGRLVYRHDVIIEHMHPIAHKSQWDERYAEVNGGAQWEHDKAVWDAYVQSGELRRVAHLIMNSWG